MDCADPTTEPTTAGQLDDIVLVSSPDELAGLDGPHADYLEPIVRRFCEHH
ncbi:hypothetical protein AB0L67_40440 [Streptomyces flaveolus]|uniref:hypothetical protein n=1 Tax=Streptomyces flaveolus TaxID=67297 RepID=UPI00343278D2